MSGDIIENALLQMENVLQDFGTVSPHWKQIWLGWVQGDFQTKESGRLIVFWYKNSRGTLWRSKELRSPHPRLSFPLNLRVTLFRWEMFEPSFFVKRAKISNHQLCIRWWERFMQSGGPISIWQKTWIKEMLWKHSLCLACPATQH